MTRVHVLCALLLLDLIPEICVGFDVCHNLIQVEHDYDKNEKGNAIYLMLIKTTCCFAWYLKKYLYHVLKPDHDFI